MALGKSLQTKLGIPATYWRITYIHSNFVTGNTDAMLSGYANKEARDGNVSKSMMDEKKFPLPSEMTRAEAYEYIKTLEDFTNAEYI